MTEARIEQTGQSTPGGAGAAALRIAVVSPTHPHTGGIAAHTTMLAHHLHDAGHDVVLVSWAHLHPSGLHRDDVAVPRGESRFRRCRRSHARSRPSAGRDRTRGSGWVAAFATSTRSSSCTPSRLPSRP